MGYKRRDGRAKIDQGIAGNEEKASSFGRMLRTARKQRTWQQQVLAGKLGIHVDYYGQIERGEALPSVPVFARLVDVLELDADELLATIPTEEPSPADEFPEIRRLLIQLRTAKPADRRVIERVLVELEKLR